MRTTATSTFALLAALPAFAAAVTLSDFTPRVSNLPSTCSAVYTQQVPGCSGSDFTSSAGCSTACIQGLQSLVQSVQSACASATLSGENVVSAFINGDGPQSLCQNAASVLSSLSPSASSASTAPAISSSSVPPTSIAPSTTSTTAQSTVMSSTSTASSMSAPSSVVVDTSSTSATSSSIAQTSSIPASSTAEASTTAKSASTTSAPIAVDTSAAPSGASSTTSSIKYSPTVVNDGSGGGSPFDTSGNMHSAASTSATPVLALLLSMTVVIMSALR